MKYQIESIVDNGDARLVSSKLTMKAGKIMLNDLAASYKRNGASIDWTGEAMFTARYDGVKYVYTMEPA